MTLGGGWLKINPSAKFLCGPSTIPTKAWGDVDIEIKRPRGSRLVRISNAAFCEDHVCNLALMWWHRLLSTPQKEQYLAQFPATHLVCPK